MVFIPGTNSSPATTGVQGETASDIIYLDLNAAGVTDPTDYAGHGWNNALFWFWNPNTSSWVALSFQTTQRGTNHEERHFSYGSLRGSLDLSRGSRRLIVY
jgi:hypothetical protein